MSDYQIIPGTLGAGVPRFPSVPVHYFFWATGTPGFTGVHLKLYQSYSHFLSNFVNLGMIQYTIRYTTMPVMMNVRR